MFVFPEQEEQAQREQLNIIRSGGSEEEYYKSIQYKVADGELQPPPLTPF